MASDTRRKPFTAARHLAITSLCSWQATTKLLAITAILALPYAAQGQGTPTSRPIKECVSTPGSNLALVSACEGLRSQLASRLTPGGSLSLTTLITLPTTGTDSNGNPTGTFAIPSSTSTNAEAEGGNSGAGGATPGSGSDRSSRATATSSGGVGANGSDNTASPSPTAGAASGDSTGASAAQQNSGNSDPNHYRNHVVIPAAVVGTVVPILLLALLICCCLALRRRKKKRAAAAAGTATGADAYHNEKEEEANAARGGLGHSLDGGAVGMGAAGAGAVIGAGAAGALLSNNEKSSLPNGHGAGHPNGHAVDDAPPGSAHSAANLTALPVMGAAAAGASQHASTPSSRSDPAAPSNISSSDQGSSASLLPAGVAGGGHQRNRSNDQGIASATAPVTTRNASSPSNDAPERFYGPSGTGVGTGSNLQPPIPGAKSPNDPSISKAMKVMGGGAGVSAAGLAGAAMYRNRNKERSATRQTSLPGAYPDYDENDRQYAAAPVQNESVGGLPAASSAPPPPAELAGNTGTWLDTQSSKHQSGTTSNSYPSDEGYARSDSDTMGNAARYSAQDRSSQIPPVPQNTQLLGAGSGVGTMPGAYASTRGTSTGATTPGTGIYDPFSTPPENRSDDEGDRPTSEEPSTVGSAGYPAVANEGAARQVQTRSPSAAAQTQPSHAVGEVIPGPWRGSNSYSPHPSGDYTDRGASSSPTAASRSSPAPPMSSTQARAITPTANQEALNLPQSGRLRENNRPEPLPLDNRVYSESIYDDNDRAGGSSEIEDDTEEAFTPRQPNRQVWVYPSQDEARAFDFGGHVSPPASPTQNLTLGDRDFGSAVEQPELDERVMEEPRQSGEGSRSKRWSIPRKPVGQAE